MFLKDISIKKRFFSKWSPMRIFLFGIDHIVWYISQFMELFPGDVINTGTPFGVAMGLNPPKYLKPGQVVKTGIEGIGEIESICMEHLG